MPATDYEKLGVFYLGRQYNLDTSKADGNYLLYESKHLCTHAVCVGMTGSGKTGLCLALLEEAAIDNIPAIIIDPKGDLGNLLLTFPDLRASDFQPWVNADDASKAGQTPAQFAEAQAAMWKKGLADWDQDGNRVKRFADSCERAIYTPGSSAGRQVAILKSLAVPPRAILDDGELFRDRVSTTATSLLGLLGIKADPMKSREHILLCNIIYLAWAANKELDLGQLIQQVQQPPFAQVGAMPLDSFYPAKERFELAAAINSLLASPSFSAWSQGEPLDIQNILYTPAGKPRLAVFSIAHLDDPQRMFFVSMLMNEILAWVRSQSGTSSLRAIVYMDEIAGYFPPVANPPSKQPMLTLMKQARAFGVGMVFATQNPVDIDYKGLANAGTWFIGRLQTEQDKSRVLDGLEGASAQASATFDRKKADSTLSRLGKRCFLMNNVHENAPVVFQTRFCMSYLRGPLTREQIKQLTHGTTNTPANANPFGASIAGTAAATLPFMPGGMEAAATSSTPSRTSTAGSSARPVLPPSIPQYFLPRRGAAPAGATVEYRPALLGFAKVWYSDTKLGIDSESPTTYLCPITSGPVAVDWERSDEIDITEDDLEKDPAPGAAFAQLPNPCADPKNFASWTKAYTDTLFRTGKLELFRSASLKQVSKPHETEAEFRQRIALPAREARDALMDKLKMKYAPKVQALQEKIRKAEQKIELQKSQASQAKLGTVVSAGAAILGGLLGRSVISSGASAVRAVGRSSRESGDVGRAEEDLASLNEQMETLQTQFKADVDAAGAAVDPSSETFDRIMLKPKKTGIQVRAVTLAWLPHYVDRTGNATPAWQ